ncbi:TPA: conjugal transfer protein TraH [Escherichia coli]|nr:conjugal transfer protein TraH [Escherichia coli]
MKRSLWLLMFFLLAGHVPAASADSACEGRFVNPITDICWSCIFPLSLGSIKVSQGKVPDTANPSMPIQICPAPPPLFRRIGLAIGYWEPMALTDVTRSPGCMVIGGLFPRTQVSQQKVCQDIAGESNIFADWAASRQGCTVGGKSDSVRDKASDKDKERVTKNINIMWNALSKNRMFDGNKELKEFVMTLIGSLVFGPNGEITPLSARTTDRSIIRAMMEGGTAKIYHCNDSDKCLKVVADTPVTISRDNALKSQITKLLASIQNKAVSDTPLDDKEKGFISSTTIPVFKYLVDPQMLGVSNSMIYQLTDYIGYDILLQYIQELIQQARAMVATGNYDEAVIEHINDNMNDATRQIAAFQSQVQVQQDALLVVDRQMSYMRQQLSARMLSRYQNNYHFGGSTL